MDWAGGNTSQGWTQSPHVCHTQNQVWGIWGGSRFLRTQEGEYQSSSRPLALRQNSVPRSKKRLFPIFPPPDPNFPWVIGLSERGREAGVSIVNREIQLGLHCRRSAARLSRQARRLFSVLISLTCLSLTPAQTPPHESLQLPHWAPRFSYPSPLPSP